MRRIKPFSSPHLLGFETGASVMAQIARSNEGYPPYNIERLLGGGPPERLRITLAVAGFSEDELDVSVQSQHLIIHGRQAERPEGTYLFRGIAARQFQRVFALSGGMNVHSAVLRNGLLLIDLIRPQEADMVRKINISTSS